MKQAHGNYVRGDRFWDREAEIELFSQRVDEGAHLLLVAQRRMGKTSLMREVAGRLADRYVCVFVDLQKCWRASDAIAELGLAIHPFKRMWQKWLGLFRNVSSKAIEAVESVDFSEVGVKLRAGLTAGSWAQKGDRLLGILAESEKPVLLLFDEVPIMVNRMLKGEDFTITPERREQTDEFMSWLRAATIRHQGRLRFVIAGSIGFEPILRQARLSPTLNTFEPFELKPWDEEVAVGCLRALAGEYGVRFEDGVERAMVERLGCCIPHHVQMFFGHVHATCKRRDDMTFRLHEIDGVYEKEMLSIRGHAELTTYEERLKMVLGGEMLPLSLDMLTEAAVTGCLTAASLEVMGRDYFFEDSSVKEVQKEILQVLEHDGYLCLNAGAGGYVFVSKLVRDWWKARHEFGYTPVSQRGA